MCHVIYLILNKQYLANLLTYEKDEKSLIVVETRASARFVSNDNNWNEGNLFNLSGHRVNSWEVATERLRGEPAPKKTNLQIWRTNMFDLILFQKSFGDRPIIGNWAKEETETVWQIGTRSYNGGVKTAAIRQTCLRATGKTKQAKNKLNYKEQLWNRPRYILNTPGKVLNRVSCNKIKNV